MHKERMIYRTAKLKKFHGCFALYGQIGLVVCDWRVALFDLHLNTPTMTKRQL